MDNDEVVRTSMIVTRPHSLSQSENSYPQKDVIHSLTGILPVRLAGFHLINPPPLHAGVISLFKKMMGREMGRRVYIHSGSVDENLMSLSKFGLGRVEMYPSIFGGQLGFE